jgi:hypothetical protein
MQTQDFIPSNAERFLHWSDNLITYLNDHKSLLTLVGAPTAAFDALQGLHDNFSDFQASLPEDATRAQISERNALQRALTAKIRYFIRFYLRRPEVTDANLIAMGIPPIDDIRTVHKVVTEQVTFEFRPAPPQNITVDFWQSHISTSKRKPTGYDGAVFIYHIGDEEPADIVGYEVHQMVSRRPFTFGFLTEDRGKSVWFRAAWQNERGIRGDFCPAQMAIVP